MTENTTTDTDYQLPTECVVPEGVDPLDDLTVGELGHVGKLIKYDPVTAVKRPEVGLRWPALAHIAWVWAKRVDPKAKLQPFLDATVPQLSVVIGLDREADAEDGDADANPTDSTPAS